MIWEDAVEQAKENLSINGYTNDWNEVIKEATKIMSQERSRISKKEHQDYLNSNEWKEKREKILLRDKHKCIKCKKLIDDILEGNKSSIFYNDIFIIKTLLNLLKIFTGEEKLYIEASEVHHLDYEYKQTPKEEEFCISLCSLCHKIAHVETKKNWEYFSKLKTDNLIEIYFIRLNSSVKYQKELKEIHEKFIKKITIKPLKFNKKLEGDNGKQS